MQPPLYGMRPHLQPSDYDLQQSVNLGSVCRFGSGAHLFVHQLAVLEEQHGRDVADAEFNAIVLSF